MRNSLLTAAVLCFFPSMTSADVIHVIDFDDPIWNATSFTTGNATTGTNHNQAAGQVTAEKGSGSSGTIAGFTIDLVDSISTVGFREVELHFTLAPNSLEWNSPITPDGSSPGDGLAIVGQGVDFRPHDGILDEAVLDAGGTFTPANPLLGGNGLVLRFSNDVDNGSISNLQMAFQSNAAGEELTVNGFEIHGTAVPEPSSFAALLLMAGCGLMRRRSSSVR